MMPRYRTSQRGFTLIEMLIVIFGLAICMMLGGTLVVTTLKVDRAGSTLQNRLAARNALATQFRADVHRAESAPAESGDIKASATCLILAMPGGDRIVYRWENEELWRMERIGGKESRRQMPLAQLGAKVEFVRPTPESKTVALKIDGPASAGNRAEFVAAIGGDWR
jgi:prepilin-type N-terminal cleavage/methylation domain-containing protein